MLRSFRGDGAFLSTFGIKLSTVLSSLDGALMVVITPALAGMAIGGLGTGLNLLGGITGDAAAQKNYQDQRALQDSSARFARWQANFKKNYEDANSQQAYWQETVNYNQGLAYVLSNRNYELTRAVNQAKVVADTRASAAGNFVQGSEAVNQEMAERSMQDAFALQQYGVAALKARSAVRANEQAGASIDRLFNDYARQMGDYETITEINAKFRDRQYTREQAGQVAQYLSAYNSQPFYEAQPFLEPVAPFVPLPALLSPAPPSITGGGPSAAAQGLNIATGVLGGVSAGVSAINSFKAGASSGKPASRAQTGFGGL
ncbi:hypothetical protein KQ313_01685 [Synechococcus sp. CS-1325]|uniref:hypothetical protein n=1 Tax=Synechococcus sp. CS-1325 TaxID=2847979 RepID=UPI000DB0204F|nr:hypothetical protein [Synechococcus sp. CS-1325]MCT0198399.1 hypothetical protein [Synechococcus sp. CS-1325]PZU97005.1 MAG: hypothetical protein DCF24_12940 [Cyanobium sp.]